MHGPTKFGAWSPHFSTEAGYLFAESHELRTLRIPVKNSGEAGCVSRHLEGRWAISFQKLERPRAFFRFSYKRKWITENATTELRSPKISHRPTMPFTIEETQKVFAAVDRYVQETSASGRENGRRLRALVLLLRYSGMRISDVVNLTVDRLMRVPCLTTTLA